jgi:WD40 repeat protein
MATASNDCKINIYSQETNKLLQTIKIDNTHFTKVRFSFDSKYLLSESKKKNQLGIFQLSKNQI